MIITEIGKRSREYHIKERDKTMMKGYFNDLVAVRTLDLSANPTNTMTHTPRRPAKHCNGIPAARAAPKES